MAGASRRTSIILTVVAIIFIIVIIILCVIPDPCRDRDPRPECHITGSAKSSLTTPKDVLTDDETSSTLSSTISTILSSTISTTLSSTKSTESSTTRIVSSSTESWIAAVSSSSEPSSTTTEDPDRVNKTIVEDDYDDYDDDSDTSATTTTYAVTNATTHGYDFSNGTTESSGTDETEHETTDGTTDMHDITNGTTYNYDTTDMTEAWTASTYQDETTNTSASESTTAEFESTTSDTTSEETTEATITSTTTTLSTTVESTTYKIPPIMISNEVCNKKTCKEVAARMLDIMDHGDVDPCQDFYQFSCGGVLDDHFLDPEDAQLPANILIEKALAKADRNDADLKELLVVYDSCLNYSISHPSENRTHEVRKVFESLGYSFDPRAISNVSSVHYPDDDFELYEALARMMKMQFTPFFDFTIDVDDKDTAQFFYKMTLPAFSSPFSENLAKQVCHKKYQKEVDEAGLRDELFSITDHYDDYVNCVSAGEGLDARLERMTEGVNALKLTSHIADSTLSSQLIAEARQQLATMLTDIGKILPKPREIRKTTLKKDYEIFTLEELDDGTAFSNSIINFSAFFRELNGKPLNVKNTEIQVTSKDILDKVFNIIQNYASNPHQLKNMMLLLWTERVYNDLVKPAGPEPGSPKYCFNTVTSLMDDYVTYLYLRELPERQSLQGQMEYMIQLFKDQVLSQIQASSSSLQMELEDKMNHMEGEVARLQDITQTIRNNRVKMSVASNDFVKNYQKLMEHYRTRLNYLQEKNPADHNALWSLLQFAYKANGVTSYPLNKYLIPHAAMSPPYYYGDDVPGYINYAGIGHMIAHELMHGFDLTGMNFTGHSRRTFKQDDLHPPVVEQTKCLKKELEATFTHNSSSGIRYLYNVDPELSLNELLVDSAASKLAWNTYMKELRAATTRHISTTRAPYRTLPPSRRRRREIDDLSYAIEGLRSRAKRQAPMPHHPGDFVGTPLPFITSFTVEQLFYLKTAQNLCSATSEINIIDVMENEHLPPSLRVNLMMRHDPMFAKAFNCPADSYMNPQPSSCQFDPLGADALTPI